MAVHATGKSKNSILLTSLTSIAMKWTCALALAMMFVVLANGNGVDDSTEASAPARMCVSSWKRIGMRDTLACTLTYARYSDSVPRFVGSKHMLSSQSFWAVWNDTSYWANTDWG